MFKPSKLRSDPPTESLPETPAPRGPRTPAKDSFRESLVALLTEVGAIANRLKLESGAELPAGAGSILQILELHGSQTVPQIASKRVTSRQNIQMLANRLAREGLIEFSGNPAHKRSSLVVLTAKGTQLLSQASQAQQNFLERLAAEIPEHELTASATLLRKIRQAILENRGSVTDRSSDESAPERGVRKPARKPKVQRDLAPTENPLESELPFNLL